MKLTGAQVDKLVEIADGADVTLVRTKGQEHVDVTRIEDGLRIRVHGDGSEVVLNERNSE